MCWGRGSGRSRGGRREAARGRLLSRVSGYGWGGQSFQFYYVSSTSARPEPVEGRSRVRDRRLLFCRQAPTRATTEWRQEMSFDRLRTSGRGVATTTSALGSEAAESFLSGTGRGTAFADRQTPPSRASLAPPPRAREEVRCARLPTTNHPHPPQVVPAPGSRSRHRPSIAGAVRGSPTSAASVGRMSTVPTGCGCSKPARSFCQKRSGTRRS